MEILGVIGPWQLVIILAIGLLLFLLPVIALVDIIRSDFNGNDKIIFTLIVLFLPFLGSIIYFLIGTNRKIRR